MHQLYHALLRMPVAMQAEGRGEEYVVSVLAYACKDELKQVVEDEMLIRNRNFVQLAELVCLQLLCTVLVLFLSYCLILMCSFVGHYGYQIMTYQHREFQSRLRDAERLGSTPNRPFLTTVR